ncbi:hypothetical protein [Algoriphagus sp. A40]|uniref:hypothetical protein n=1 Tax=Algoriphagus sp. A40 TaxID=1945863 RepID=UPI00098548F4|nr:hypothetical protein [Algoriphagus sp. A40]OOG72222.1 hypothetical protein B0E43_16470 [Algoriphagus sp. A40]
MENFSLAELKSLIEEEIYLIPEDREAILAQMEGNSSLSPKTKPSDPVRIEIREINSEVAVPVQLHEPKPEPQVVVEESFSEPIPIRGNFSKGVLILHEETQLSAEVMEMLVKMINACGHSMNEVGLVASENLEGRSMEEFQSLNAHTVLKFGRISHPINAVPARLYEVYSENETEYLFADSLSMIGEDVNLKKKLWTSLQVLFNLSSSKK